MTQTGGGMAPSEYPVGHAEWNEAWPSAVNIGGVKYTNNFNPNIERYL